MTLNGVLKVDVNLVGFEKDCPSFRGASASTLVLSQNKGQELLTRQKDNATEPRRTFRLCDPNASHPPHLRCTKICPGKSTALDSITFY
jgi:hypothetical protein